MRKRFGDSLREDLRAKRGRPCRSKLEEAERLPPKFTIGIAIVAEIQKNKTQARFMVGRAGRGGTTRNGNYTRR